MLDAVYEEGQLSPDEHEARTAAAMAGATLGELRALTADLQIPDYVRSPAPLAPPGVSGRRRLAIGAGLAALAIVVVAGAVAIASASEDAAPAEAPAAEPTAAPVAAGEPEPIVVEPIDTLSADGLRQFLRLLQERFGTVVVDDVSLYRDNAILTQPVPGQPHREQDWMFEGGFQPWGSASSRDRDQATVDLAALDADGLARLLADAPALVRLPSGRADRAMIRPQDDEAVVTVYVTDLDDRSGHLTATLAGDVRHVWVADQ